VRLSSKIFFASALVILAFAGISALSEDFFPSVDAGQMRLPYAVNDGTHHVVRSANLVVSVSVEFSEAI